MRIRDPGWRQFGSWIRDGKKSDPDKHPEFATPDLCLENDFSVEKCMKSMFRIRDVYHQGVEFFSLIHELNFFTPDPNFVHLGSEIF
jgi:hypothetical protein